MGTLEYGGITPLFFMPESFGTLFKSSSSFFSSRFAPIVIGVAVFALAQFALVSSSSALTSSIDNVVLTASILSIFALLINLAGSAYFWILAVRDTKDTAAIANEVPRLLLPLFGTWLWSFFRSYGWVAFLASFLLPFSPNGGVAVLLVCMAVVSFAAMLLILPRVSFASLILIEEKKGVFESVQLSMDRTNGYWGKIFGNMLLMGICLIPIVFLVGIVVGILSSVAPVIDPVVQSALSLFISAFFTIFTVKLGRTVMAHPKVSQKAA